MYQVLPYIGWVNFPLNNIKDGNVTTAFGWDGGYHTVLGLEQAAHDVEYSRFSDRLCLKIKKQFSRPDRLRSTILTRSTCSLEKGVYAVVKKWQRGVGIREETMPTKSLFI